MGGFLALFWGTVGDWVIASDCRDEREELMWPFYFDDPFYKSSLPLAIAGQA
jgi:hypothetical protein